MRALNQQEFLKTPAGIAAQQKLKLMIVSSSYDTNGSSNDRTGTGRRFMDRHLDYLAKHPNVLPEAYLSNLRIMTKTGER